MNGYEISRRAAYYAQQRQERAALERLARQERAARRRGARRAVQEIRDARRYLG